MLTRLSKRLFYVVDVVVTGGADSEAAEVAEIVADAITDAVEEIADAVSDVSDTGSGSTVVDHEGRIVALEIGFAALASKLEETSFKAEVASDTASAALSEAADAVDAADVEAMIEATEFEDTDKDGDIDVVDAPDEPPANTRTSLVFASKDELKSRFFGKRDN